MPTDVREGLALRRRARSFVYAARGWLHVLRTQPNAWIHAIISLGVVGLAFWLRVNRIEWAILLLTIMLVWMAEFFNTALEAAVDMAMPDIHPLAGTAKDVAAAAVLVGAVGSVIIGLIILGPPLWLRLFGPTG